MSGYRTASLLDRAGGGSPRLGLATALASTPSGLVENPTFFSGFVARADITAGGLLAVADVAGSRYADVGAMQRLATLDPVVTASGDRLRFESFSACNGVYARFDLLPEGLDGNSTDFGTTNVDINQPLRTALARTTAAEPLHLTVGQDELRVSRPAGTHVERAVDLPDRWVRGLAEVPTLLSGMQQAGELTGPAIALFLGGLPRVAPPGPTLHVLPARGWRTTALAVPGSVPLPGVSRLRGADRLTRHATRLTVHVHGNGTAAWVFTVPGGRLTLALSPGPFRGFSGEGTLLTLLARPDADADGLRLLDALGWSPAVDQADLATRTGLDPAAVRAGLAWLAASGRLGYDLAEGAWFHRQLPIDGDRVLRRNPRLVGAHRLVDRGAVRPGADPSRWRVLGDGDTYDVTTGGDGFDCTCPWVQEHGTGRGPCKHVLAVILVSPQPRGAASTHRRSR